MKFNSPLLESIINLEESAPPFNDQVTFSLALKVNTEKIPISVNAENFLCYDRETEVSPTSSQFNLFGTRFNHSYFNADIGIVVNQCFFASSPEIQFTFFSVLIDFIGLINPSFDSAHFKIMKGLFSL